MMQIYIYRDGENTGPFARDEIFVRVRQKEFSMDDLACTEGMPEWKPLAEVLSAKATMVVLAERELPPAPPVLIPRDESAPSFGTRPMETLEPEAAETADAVAGLKRLAAMLVLGACLYQFGWAGWEKLRGQFASAEVRPAAAVVEESSAGEAPVKGTAEPQRVVGNGNAGQGEVAAAGVRREAETGKGAIGSDEAKAAVSGANGSQFAVPGGGGALVGEAKEAVREASPSQVAANGAGAAEGALVQGVDGAVEAGSVAVEQPPASREPAADEDPDAVPGLAVQPASYFKKR